MKNVGIFLNTEKVKARSELKRLKNWLQDRECKPVVVGTAARKLPRLDFALSLGGDGTMLRASRTLAPLHVPVLGVNLGSLGFLAETNPDELFSFLTSVLAGNYQVEERMMLSVTLETKKKKICELALNDAIIQSGMGRVVDVTAAINGEFLASYLGDGLIVSTPTGSTAYSLAASGPIVHPYLSVFVLTPICPHTLAQRPLIISTKHALTLKAAVKHEEETPVLSLDGQLNYNIEEGDLITIEAAETPFRMIVNPARKYFSVLRAKLKWGERG